uniref:Uncharacterized protein n=1 Tax=Panagrolaimus sp. PS1159 TaxID=55785 RepID=A0AC35EWW8_9BILA
MMNWYRFGSLPHSLKIITFFGTLSIMISMSSAEYQRGGIGLVWTTSLLALISNIAMILIILLEIEVLLTPPKLRMFSWNFM